MDDNKLRDFTLYECGKTPAEDARAGAVVVGIVVICMFVSFVVGAVWLAGVL